MEEPFKVTIKNICGERFIITIKDGEPKLVGPNGGIEVFPLEDDDVLTIYDPNLTNIPLTNITLPEVCDLNFIPKEKIDEIIISHDEETKRPVLVTPPSDVGWTLKIMLPSEISSIIGPDDNVTIGDGERRK